MPPGHVVVAAHTVRGASEVKVTLPDQSTATARVVGCDAPSDIAVLQLALPRTRSEALRPVVLGASSSLRIGQVREPGGGLRPARKGARGRGRLALQPQ